VPYRQLRHAEKDVLLLCDRLCIELDDIEKGHQVRRMKDTYSDASKVVAWLSDMCIA
jgi:hypothetical protein